MKIKNSSMLLLFFLCCATSLARNELSTYLEGTPEKKYNPFDIDDTESNVRDFATDKDTSLAQELKNVVKSTSIDEDELTQDANQTSISLDSPTVSSEVSENSTKQEDASSADAESGDIPFDEFAQKMPLEFLPATKKESKPAEIERSIEFNFEDADLQNLVTQISEIFDVTFIADDIIEPLAQGSKIIKGNKISFKTQKPLSKQEAWNLFVTFLDLAGFAITPEGQPRMYRIKTIEQARKSPLASYIGVHPDQLPDNDEMIRYVYFIKNSSADTIDNIIRPLTSSASALIMLKELRAFVLTDKAYNVRSLLKIVKEIDKAAMPQSMAVLKLRQADAIDVQKLYKELMKGDDPGYGPRSASQRKQPTTTYFPENATIIAEPRSNALIILGPEDAIKRIEEFITKYVDVDLDQPYSPLFVYQVKYADAQSIADVMSKITDFGASTEVGKAGGVRGGDKYIKQMSFTAEKESNQLIIKGDYEDYIRAKEIIEALDEPQPQVAIEVLLVSIDVNKAKELGSQIRTKIPGPDGLLGKNVNFQTSGIKMGRSQGSTIIPKFGDNARMGVKRLLGNLLNTVLNPSLAGVGNTVINFGVDACGVWGIFNILESMSSAEVISNPFLVATNKTASEVSVGQTRRVVTSTVVSGDNDPVNGFGDFTANLTLNITPQINSDGMIVLDIKIQNDEFTGATDDVNTAAKLNRVIDTKTILADKEVLAIGGLIQNRTISGVTKLPILGDIPVLGWLFKNKSKTYTKSNVVALISVRIVQPDKDHEFNAFTQRHMDNYYEAINYMQNSSTAHDPVNRLFFKDKRNTTDRAVEDLLFERAGKPLPEDLDTKRQLVSHKKRSKWANKRGRRKRRKDRYESDAPQKEVPAVPKPDAHDTFENLTEQPVEQLMAKQTSMRKTSKKRSLFDKLFEEDEDQT